jgi:hypothetical protein
LGLNIKSINAFEKSGFGLSLGLDLEPGGLTGLWFGDDGLMSWEQYW